LDIYKFTFKKDLLFEFRFKSAVGQATTAPASCLQPSPSGSCPASQIRHHAACRGKSLSATDKVKANPG